MKRWRRGRKNEEENKKRRNKEERKGRMKKREEGEEGKFCEWENNKGKKM